MKAQKLILFMVLINQVMGFSQQINCSIPKECIIDSVIEGQHIKYLKNNTNEITNVIVEKTAKFQDGDVVTFRDWVINQIDYRNFSSDTAIYGKMFIFFTITKDGKINDVIISKGLSPKIDKEIYRVINLSPDWVPARQRGRKTDQLLGLQIKINKQINK